MDDLYLNSVKVHRSILPDDKASGSNSNSRSKSAPPSRLGRDMNRQGSRDSNLSKNLGRRAMGKTLKLAPEWQWSSTNDPALTGAEEDAVPEQVPIEFQGPGQYVRVRCYCIGDSFDRLALQEQIIKRSRNMSVRAFTDVLCSKASYNRSANSMMGDILYFDFGCVVFWGLEKSAEQHVLREIAVPCISSELPISLYERDSMVVHYTTQPGVEIENDTLALHYKHAEELEVKLAVSFALAQSTKLSVFEAQMRGLATTLNYLPLSMAEVGDVTVSEKEIIQHTGELYRFVSAVNLLGQVLDMPATLYDTQTNIKSLYKSVFDYLELEERIQLLNDRFSVLSEMLSILRTHVAQSKFSHLEAIIMWLVALCAVLALFQLLIFLGWTPAWRRHDGGLL